MSIAAAPNHAHATAGALFQELARSGLEHVVICPGSRSTPLVVAATRQPGLRCWSQIDERSAGFFALGLAKASRAPVAVVCTSGTAAANLHPAVIESHYARVPLLVLTADRPAELREWGAGQTIDQVRLYGRAVRWFAEAPLPEASDPLLRHTRALACRAVAEARGRPPGPVHLNFPFREPLEPVEIPGDVPPDLGSLAAAGRPAGPYFEVASGPLPPTAADVDALAALIESAPRGAIACGPLDAAPDLCASIGELARAAGWPVLAEPTSQLRCGHHTDGAPMLASYDLLLRDDDFAARQRPDAVLRLGATPTSKSFRLWLERHRPPELVLVDPDESWNDPSHLVSRVLRADPLPLCAALVQRLAARGHAARSGAWLAAFLDAESRAQVAIDRELAEDEALLEARAVRELAEALPSGALLYVSNSMPVRDLDAFLPVSTRPLRVLCNRGANGIDGMVSSALGASAAQTEPVVLLTGDLAFLHDLGGLVAAKRHGLDATIVVLDNDGGGIFSFLPIADHGDAVAFEEHFVTPHGLDVGAIATSLGASTARVTSWEHFRSALKDTFARRGLSVISVPIDREQNVAQQRRIQRAVSAAIAGGAPR